MTNEKTKTLKIVYLAFVLSTMTWYYVAWTISQSDRADLGPSIDNPLLIPLLAAGYSLLFVSWWLPKKMMNSLSKNIQKQKLTFDGDINKYFVPLLLRGALIEANLILGFIVAITSSDLNAFYVFFASSLLGFLLSFPTESRLQNLIHGKF